MGAKQSTTYKNYMDNYIKNTNKTVYDILHQTVTNVTNDYITNNTQNSQNDASITNNITIKNININGSYTYIDINQVSQIQIRLQTIAYILQNTDVMNNIQSTISSSFANILNNNSNLKTDMAAVMELKKNITSDGELNNAIGTIGQAAINAMDDLTGKETQTYVENTFRTNLENKNITDITTQDIINNYLNTTIETDNNTFCINTNNFANILQIGDININGNHNIYTSFQTLLNETTYACILDSITKIEDLKTITDQNLTTLKDDLSNKAQADARQRTQFSQDDSKTSKSIVTDFMQYLTYIIIAVVLVFGLAIGIPLIKGIIKPKDIKNAITSINPTNNIISKV